MLVDHLFQYRISPWSKTAEKRVFCTGVTDGPMDRPSYIDAFLTDASKNVSLTQNLAFLIFKEAFIVNDIGQKSAYKSKRCANYRVK